MKKRVQSRFLVVAVLLAAALLFFALRPTEPSILPKTTVTFAIRGGNITFTAEVAATEASRAAGLMGREKLAENEGMLFVFDDEGYRNFWMFNTLIPLDIIFISSEKAVVDKRTMFPCGSPPCTVYRSRAPARYALEVHVGRSENIFLGDRVSIGAY